MLFIPLYDTLCCDLLFLSRLLCRNLKNAISRFVHFTDLRIFGIFSYILDDNRLVGWLVIETNLLKVFHFKLFDVDHSLVLWVSVLSKWYRMLSSTGYRPSYDLNLFSIEFNWFLDLNLRHWRVMTIRIIRLSSLKHLIVYQWLLVQ